MTCSTRFGRPFAGWWNLLVVPLVLIVVGSSRPAQAQAFSATIDFESFPNSTASVTDGIGLTTQYASDNVEFEYAFPSSLPIIVSTSAPIPHSPTHEVVSPTYGKEFANSDFQIHFRSPQSFVQFYGGSDCDNATGTLTAYDSSGALAAPPVQNVPLTANHTSVQFMISDDQPDNHP